MHNTAAVAGVFLVVGVLAAAVLLLVGLCIRRRRQQHNRRKRWIDGIQRPIPPSSDPFNDSRDLPIMRSVNITRDNASWDGRRHTLLDDSASTSPMFPGEDIQGPGISGIGAGSQPMKQYAEGPFSDIYSYRPQGIGLAISTGPGIAQSRPSLAQSSPSVYPATLPRDDASSIYEDVELDHREEPNPPVAPPRPPRSVLRDMPSNSGLEYRPITPPQSVSSHSHNHSAPPSPIVEIFKAPPTAFPGRLDIRPQSKGGPQEDIFNRRTLLDVSS